MRIRPPVLIGIALLIGLLAAVLVVRIVVGDGGGAKSIVVAVEEIVPGSKIKQGQVKAIAWASPKLPEGAFQNVADVVGRVPRLPIHMGEPVFNLHLTRQASKAGMPAIIAEGKRAISISADEVIGVAGFALPGSYVDVLVSAKDNEGVPFSKIVLEAVKVLAAEQNTMVDPNQPVVVKAVTLEMTPQEAERLDLARSIGKLSLVLRSEFDRQPSGSRGAQLPDLFNGSDIKFSTTAPVQPVPSPTMAAVVTPPTQPAPPAPRPAEARTNSNTWAIEEIRGTSRGGAAP